MTDYNGEFTRKTTRSYAQQQLILSVTKVKTQQEMLIKKQDNQKNKQKRFETTAKQAIQERLNALEASVTLSPYAAIYTLSCLMFGLAFATYQKIMKKTKAIAVSCYFF